MFTHKMFLLYFPYEVFTNSLCDEMIAARIGAPLMGLTVARIAMRVVEVLFFTGLVGCVSTVVLSWISVGRDSFFNK